MMDDKELWQKIVKDLEQNPRDFETIPNNNRTPLNFHAKTTDDLIIIDSSASAKPSCRLTSPRKINFSEFQAVYTFYDDWKRNTEGIRKEASKASRNTAYIFPLISCYCTDAEEIKHDGRIETLSGNTIEIIKQDKKLSKYYKDQKLPAVYIGKGEIKLIVLGQDPTVKEEKQRGKITTVLNLDKNGPLKSYISDICTKMGINIEANIYATNLIKNFFIKKPTDLEKEEKKKIIAKYAQVWIDTLKAEIEEYPDVPILTLGNPILEVLINKGQAEKIKEYWGYTKEWKQGIFSSFSYIKASDNILNRTIIPFPHQTSLRKEFYKEHIDEYCKYIVNEALIR